MLFKRRTAEPLKQKITNLVWPKMGFKRVLDYYKHRSVRIPASDHSIAAGLAFGCLVSWTPLFGTHLIQCIIFSWITRTNVIAAFIGTAFGNLLTTPLLMLIAYHVGKVILHTLGFDVVHHVDPSVYVGEEAYQAPKIFLPTLVGGYAVGIATFPLFYYPFFYMVKSARARRARIEKKIHKEVVEVTGQKRLIIGIGSDILDSDRLGKVLERFGERFIKRCFTTAEIAKAERRRGAGTHIATYAKRFAAKEACAKALGTGFSHGVFMKDIGVVNDYAGKPDIVLTGGALLRLQSMVPEGKKPLIHLTLTDEPPMVQAQVLIEAV